MQLCMFLSIVIIIFYHKKTHYHYFFQDEIISFCRTRSYECAPHDGTGTSEKH